MARDQLGSVALIWQLGHVGKQGDVFAEPPHSVDKFSFSLFVGFRVDKCSGSQFQRLLTPVEGRSL